MKNLKYIIPFIAFLLFACDTDDDGFYNTVYVQSEQLMDVETQDVYQVGETFFINAHIPELLFEPGETTLLNVRETTGNAPSFSFSFYLEKKNASGEWDVVDIGSNFVDGGAGNAQVFFGVGAYLTYNDAAEEYQFRGGITLTEPGEYRLDFSNTTENFNKVSMLSNSIDNNIILNIFSTSSDLDASGFHNFIVVN